jgi:hypothetical protein
MGSNPQAILQQQVSVANQPTATDPTLSQTGQTTPISQFAGVAGPSTTTAGSIQPPANLLSTASPGQPTTPGVLSFANTPQAAPYYQMVPFLAALETQPQLSLPDLGDPALQGIQQKLIAQQKSNPLLSGKQAANPNSILAKAQATQRPMSVGDFLSAAGQGIWQQEIVQPVQDYIQTWQRDPTMGLLETLGGVAMVGGIIGLEAITGGAATPFIFAGLAALQAPSLIQAWGNEITNPSDQHLVQAMVSSGAAALAVGSPVRAFKGIKIARNLLEAQVNLRKDAIATDQVASLLTGFREAGTGLPGIKTAAPLGEQMETLDLNDVEKLTDQLTRHGADLNEEDSPAARLIQHAQTLEKLRKDIADATAAGDTEGVGETLKAIRELGPDLRSAMLSTAYHYTFLPSTPYAHVPLGPIQGIGQDVYEAVSGHYNAISGLLHQLHAGIGLQGPHEMATTNLASLKEAEGLDRAAGTPYDVGNRIELQWQGIRDQLGIADDAQEERVLQALEEPKKWAALTPQEKLYGQKLRDFFDSQTAGELKFGYISHALQGRVPYSFMGPALLQDAAKQRELETEAALPYRREPKAHSSKSRQWQLAVDEIGNVRFTAKNRASILQEDRENKELYQTTHEHRQVYGSNEKDIDRWRRQYGQHKQGAKKANPQKAAQIENEVRQRLGSVGIDLLTMKRKRIGKIMSAKPPADELVTGAEAVRRAFRTHISRMQNAIYREAAQVHSNLNMSKLADIFKKMPVSNWGAAMTEHPTFKNLEALPDVLEETVWSGASNIEGAAQKMGYFPIFQAVGRKGDLNYRPALYGRGKLANDISKATANATSVQLQNDFLSAFYKLSGVTKRFIMYNPVYHFLNVAGRAVAFVMSDPAVAGSAFKAVKQLHADPAAYNDLLVEAGNSGMVHALQWNVGDKVRRLLREEDGQSIFPGAIRTPIQAFSNFHADTAERGLWSTVNQLQLAGYLYSKTRFLEKGISEYQSRRLAAQYANNLGGMVNPLYMGRLWRQLKGMIFFAPSYWSTFLHSATSVMPGSARMSSVLHRVAGGRFAGLASDPFRAVDQRSRVELTRAQRDWMVTYLAATAVSMDMMNVMFSGHHLWDNESGHEWDVDVTNMPGLGGTQTSPSGEVRRAYITSMPFFRQGADIGNAIGLGHDWGFGHVFGDQTWQQQDVLHKTMLATGALLDGVRRTASSKVGQVPSFAYGLATGEELTSRLGTNTQVKVDRPLAVAALAPGGYQLERLWKTYQQDTLQYAPGTPQYQQAQQQFFDNAKAYLPMLLVNQLGLPSIYHMGVEKPAIDDSKYENWQAQRTQSQDRMTAYSKAVFDGQMTPLEYARHKHEEQIRMNQLNNDTWGTNSPGATLNAAYTSLAQQFHLDDPNLSDQDWFEAYDAFLPAWTQLLQSASPATRAAWWEHSTSQWTDADYLEWEAHELRDSLAASIDGQGGNYIRAFQNQLFRLKPTLTVQEYTDAEAADPFYSAYKTMLSAMGATSPLGAFVSAFSSPYSKTYIPPAGTTPDEAQAIADHTGNVVIRPETAQALAAQAKQVAQEPDVAQAGGIAAASPQFVQQERAAIEAAQQEV